MPLLVIILSPLLGALLPFSLAKRQPVLIAWAAAAGPCLALLFAIAPLRSLFGGMPTACTWPWAPLAGLDLHLRMDGLAALFILLILGMGLMIILYAHYYLGEREQRGRFYGLLLLFMGAMLGVVLSDHLLLLLVFWELTSLSSFLLIGFWHRRTEARRGAATALLVTGAGGLAMLAGFLLLGHLAGTFRISLLMGMGDIVRAHPLYPPCLLLILLGACTKSAQFPFHFWLPRAMEAPTPVSAYLHSATMVKAGVFLLARLFPVLAGTDLWFYTVAGTGLATLLFGAYAALFQHDLKALLAYSTISHLGLIVLLFGLDTPLAAVAAVFHLINHATFKASLFMCAGIIDHGTGSRDMRRINGLRRYMPHTANLAMVAAAAMAGVPLLNGFLSKEMFFAQTLHHDGSPLTQWLLPAAATVAGVCSVAYSARFIHDVFFNGEPAKLPIFPPHEAPRLMRLPMEILVGLCLLVGLLPNLTVAPFLELAATAMLNRPPPPYDLAIWHGFNTPLLMSSVALAGGLVLYSRRQILFRFHHQVLPFPDQLALLTRAIQPLLDSAAAIAKTATGSSLQRSVFLLLLTATAAVLVPLTTGKAPLSGSLPVSTVDGLTLVGAAIMIMATLFTVRWHRHRLLALIPLSVVGLMTALAFVRFSAPDLALTQLAVEVVTILLLLLALYFLPQQSPIESSPWRRRRDLALAFGLGGGTGLVVWAMLTRPHTTIADYYVRNAIPGGGGANIVNVILVDFRGFDTLGEITVLAIAALAIVALLDALCLRPGKEESSSQQWAVERHPLILSQVTRLLLPLALMVSLYLFLRGHNAPGGGFIAGLITAVALILQYMASGIAWTERQWQPQLDHLVAGGLLVALATGLGSWLFDRPFLTSTFGHIHLPLLGDIELASAMLFDLGVYLTVVGVVLLILATLGKLSRRCKPAPLETPWKR